VIELTTSDPRPQRMTRRHWPRRCSQRWSSAASPRAPTIPAMSRVTTTTPLTTPSRRHGDLRSGRTRCCAQRQAWSDAIVEPVRGFTKVSRALEPGGPQGPLRRGVHRAVGPPRPPGRRRRPADDAGRRAHHAHRPPWPAWPPPSPTAPPGPLPPSRIRLRHTVGGARRQAARRHGEVEGDRVQHPRRPRRLPACREDVAARGALDLSPSVTFLRRDATEPGLAAGSGHRDGGRKPPSAQVTCRRRSSFRQRVAGVAVGAIDLDVLRPDCPAPPSW